LAHYFVTLDHLFIHSFVQSILFVLQLLNNCAPLITFFNSCTVMLAFALAFTLGFALAFTPAPPRTLSPMSNNSYALGFDFGTSGVRCVVIDAAGVIVACPASKVWGAGREERQESDDWEVALFSQLESLPKEVRSRVSRIAISGTSGSVLLVSGDGCGEPVKSRGRPRMYNFSVTKQAAGDSGSLALALIAKYSPEGTAHSATSSLAKMLAYHFDRPLIMDQRLAHQADFLASRLTGSQIITSDWHNSLKLGFDVNSLTYPNWMTTGEVGRILNGRLPSVVRPGEPIAPVSASNIAKYGLSSDCIVVGGTTDSIAAFLAAGASEVGDAVTSLGSTVAIKLLSDTPVNDASSGIYSHRLGDRWLVGGASNAGCRVLRELGFSDQELVELSENFDPLVEPPVTDYYPLPSSVVGDRFPHPNQDAVGKLEPVPEDRAAFLHCILHGIAALEAEGYRALASRGSPKLRKVFTSGGGSRNEKWRLLRERMLGVPTLRAANIDAAFGAAILAARGI